MVVGCATNADCTCSAPICTLGACGGSSTCYTATTASYTETEHEEEEADDNTAETAAAVATIAAAAAAAPPPVNMFPPQGAPQPGNIAAGGGLTPAVALTVATVATDVALLTAGIAGAVVISVYSSDLAQTGFLIPRTVDATAALFTEPDDAIPNTSISRQSSYGGFPNNRACKRPIIRLGAKINAIENKKKQSPFIRKISKRFAKVQARIAPIKMRVVDKLGIGCLVPKLIHPFEPMFRYLRCKLGLDEDEYMEAAQCNEISCDESLEEKVITNSRPAPMIMMDLDVQTMSDCFGEMREVQYGARVLAKIVRDASCDDPQYEQICQELMNENRVIEEDGCRTRNCTGQEDDPFRPCFGCEGFVARQIFGSDYYNDRERSFISRQTGENFQTTKQSRRLICRNGRQNCRLRVSRGMQLRKRTYARAQEFVQSEQYLTEEDTNILRYYIRR